MRMHARSLSYVGAVLAVVSVGCSSGVEQEKVASAASELTTTYQAENAFDIDEGVIESQHAGFTGSGYLNINNFDNTFAWYSIDRPVAGTVSLTVRYANGASTARPIRVSAGGGGSATIAGAPTGSWSTWTTATVNIAMAAGNNDFFLSSVTADGMPNIDKFDLAQSFTRAFQAEENVFDIDEGVIESVNPGYTGTGYLNIDNFSNTFAWYVIDSPAAATVAVTVRYANGASTARPFDVQGRTSARIAGTPTGSWSTWRTATVNIQLDAGEQDFHLFSVTNDGMPNIDKYDITW